jgi:hypothetical protein
MLAKVFLQKILVNDPAPAGHFFTTHALAGRARVVPALWDDGDVFYMRPYDLSSNLMSGVQSLLTLEFKDWPTRCAAAESR